MVVGGGRGGVSMDRYVAMTKETTQGRTEEKGGEKSGNDSNTPPYARTHTHACTERC